MSDAHQVIDDLFRSYLSSHPDMAEHWLLEQTLYTGVERRELVQRLPLSEGQSVLDIGTGFGALAFDLAVFLPLHITAIDLRGDTILHTKNLYDQLVLKNCLQSGSNIQIELADLYHLPYGDQSFDFVIARFVYQHLSDPAMATKEINRVVKPGGFIYLIDVDDQLNLSYPEVSPAFAILQNAFAKLQQARGGDRFVGRKLASLLGQFNLRILSSQVQTQSGFAFVNRNDLGHSYSLQRLAQSKQGIIERQILAEAEFDHHFQQFASETDLWQFQSSSQIAVLGQKQPTLFMIPLLKDS